MTVKERLITVRIVERIIRKPKYAESIGISVSNAEIQHMKEGKKDE